MPPATWLPRRSGLVEEAELPNVAALQALALAPLAVAPSMPPPERPEAPEAPPAAPPAQPPQALPAPLFVAHVPPRMGKPRAKPQSFDELLDRLTAFEGKPGLRMFLACDFLAQLKQESSHLHQDVRRWQRRVALCRDSGALFRLGPCTGMPGERPWAATEDCLRAIYQEFYSP